ncbi:hypothetical protein D9M71_823530 [compost metagenome]
MLKNNFPEKVRASDKTFSPVLVRRMYQPPGELAKALAAAVFSAVLPFWIKLSVASYKLLSVKTVWGALLEMIGVRKE